MMRKVYFFIELNALKSLERKKNDWWCICFTWKFNKKHDRFEIGIKRRHFSPSCPQLYRYIIIISFKNIKATENNKTYKTHHINVPADDQILIRFNFIRYMFNCPKRYKFPKPKQNISMFVQICSMFRIPKQN